MSSIISTEQQWPYKTKYISLILAVFVADQMAQDSELGGSRSESNPVTQRISDIFYSECLFCQKPFSLATHTHHCRQCGVLVCADRRTENSDDVRLCECCLLLRVANTWVAINVDDESYDKYKNLSVRVEHRTGDNETSSHTVVGNGAVSQFSSGAYESPLAQVEEMAMLFGCTEFYDKGK